MAAPEAGANGDHRRPDFLILGAPKSGTTSLAAWLAAHPRVFIPVQKELHFFSRDDRWGAGPAWYGEQFAGAGDRLAGEATPNYLDDHRALDRIGEVAPRARLIALLREPVERAWSHYAYDAELDIERTTFAAVAGSAGTTDEHRYVRQGRYADHLEHVLQRVGRDQLLVLWFDDLRDRPEETWRTVCDFLGLAADPVPPAVGTVHNAHYRLRMPWLRALMIRHRAWKRLPFGLAGRIDRGLRAERGYSAIPAEQRALLQATYAQDNARLASLLGRPLPGGWADGQ